MRYVRMFLRGVGDLGAAPICWNANTYCFEFQDGSYGLIDEVEKHFNLGDDDNYLIVSTIEGYILDALDKCELAGTVKHADFIVDWFQE